MEMIRTTHAAGPEHHGCDHDGVFAALPFDLLKIIVGTFAWPDLWSASTVCKAWYQGLAPLREGMMLVQWGKKFKHGKGGVAQNLDKALEIFLEGAQRGCPAAMVNAGLMLWELEKYDEALRLYTQAARLDDPEGLCNLGLAYLDRDKQSEAVELLDRAAVAGNVRAQYNLAVCYQQGRGCAASQAMAADLFGRAAKRGCSRAMYNLALCFRDGLGVPSNNQEMRRWMEAAARAGHARAQCEHGLALLADGIRVPALAFLEMATRAGESSATHFRNMLLRRLGLE